MDGRVANIQFGRRTLMCLEFCWYSNEDSGLSSESVGLTKGCL